MGSPVVAILGLVLGYTFLYAAKNNLSLVAAFQGQEQTAPTTGTTGTAATPTVTTAPASTLAPSSPVVNIGKVKAI